MLLNQHPSQALNRHLKDASDGLTTHVDEINRLYAETRDVHQRRNAKRTRDGETGADASSELDQLQQKVAGMTERMESSLRKCIDAQAKVEAVNKALKEIQGNAQRAANTQATQVTAAVTQDGEENNEDPTQGPEPLQNAFHESLEKHTDLYMVKRPKLRYKEHAWFSNFKQTAYYAAHGDEAKRPNPDDWFEEDGGPRPGETGGAMNDEDFEEMGERISTKCPLTLQDFQEPVTSKKCPHSFEKSAILELIRNVRPPTRGRNQGWTQDIECPVGGCSSRLMKDDLEDDIRLKMLIKRKQRQQELARQQAEEENEDRRREERDGTRVEEIDSASEDDINAVERDDDVDTSAPISIKREKARRTTQRDDIELLDDD